MTPTQVLVPGRRRRLPPLLLLLILLILLLLLEPVWTCRMGPCYDEQQLSSEAERRLRGRFPQPPEPPSEAAPDSAGSCPLDLYRHQQHLSYRSLSPWRYTRVMKKDHYPSTYVEAKCLCEGCILIKDQTGPVHSPDYNSVPIRQSRLFLKRELCCDGKKYHLTRVAVDVSVGCTCVRPRTSYT